MSSQPGAQTIPLERERCRRHAAWGVTWLAYAGYYLCRKGFSVSKKTIAEQFGLSEYTLATIDTGYLGAYAGGQFISGILGDRSGARRLIGGGMLLSAACCAVFGASSAALMFTIAFCANGLAQSTGWPGTTRAMTEWTTPKNRGRVMAFWATCYSVGGIVATGLAGRLLGGYGWRAAFFVPACVVAAIGLLVLLILKAPSRVQDSSPSRARGSESSRPVKPPSPRERRAAQRQVLKNRTLWHYGGCYFFIKLIRYSLLFWLPFYLSKSQGYSPEHAAYVSTAFEVGGIVGVITMGVASDRLQNSSRSLLAGIGLVLLAGALLLYTLLGQTGTAGNVLCLGLIGVMLFGPDSLVSGAAAQDLGGKNAASMATGFVNGMGSLGAVLQGWVTAYVSRTFGWDRLFVVFVSLALISAAVLIPTFRNRRPAAA